MIETAVVQPAPRLSVSYSGEGPLVLFLHGIRGNRLNWNPQLDVEEMPEQIVDLVLTGLCPR